MTASFCSVKRYVHIVDDVQIGDKPSMATEIENKTQHLHILMAPSEVEAIDDWGFKNRIRTRAEAIRRLCQMALVLDDNLTPIHDANQKALLAFNRLGHQMANVMQAGGEVSGNDIKQLGERFADMFEHAMRTTLILRSVSAAAYEFKEDKAMDEAMAAATEVEEFFREQIAKFDQAPKPTNPENGRS